MLDESRRRIKLHNKARISGWRHIAESASSQLMKRPKSLSPSKQPSLATLLNLATSGTPAMMVIGVKSRRGSYGNFEYKNWLDVIVAAIGKNNV